MKSSIVHSLKLFTYHPRTRNNHTQFYSITQSYQMEASSLISWIQFHSLRIFFSRHSAFSNINANFSSIPFVRPLNAIFLATIIVHLLFYSITTTLCFIRFGPLKSHGIYLNRRKFFSTATALNQLGGHSVWGMAEVNSIVHTYILWWMVWNPL